MKFYPVRYWWSDRTGERTASTVTSGSNAADALKRFKNQHPHLSNAVILTARNKGATK